jgi:hypothetical protein
MACLVNLTSFWLIESRSPAAMRVKLRHRRDAQIVVFTTLPAFLLMISIGIVINLQRGCIPARIAFDRIVLPSNFPLHSRCVGLPAGSTPSLVNVSPPSIASILPGATLGIEVGGVVLRLARLIFQLPLNTFCGKRRAHGETQRSKRADQRFSLHGLISFCENSSIHCVPKVIDPAGVFSGRYCLSATIVLLTLWPWAFLPVWMAVSVLPSAEIATLVVTVGLPSTLLTT